MSTDDLSRNHQIVRKKDLDLPAPFVGSRALAAGDLTDHQLRSRHRRLFPDVYAEASLDPDPMALVHAAGLWAPAGAILAGSAAALLHGERWYGPEEAARAVDLYITGTPRTPPGIRLRRIRDPLPHGQLTRFNGLVATSPARTAVDMARWEDDDDTAIAKVDAVCNRTGTTIHSVAQLTAGLRGVNGLPRVRRLLRFCDSRADSPPETKLRLLICRSDLPDPTPQLTIRNDFGAHVAVADLGYEAEKVAIFYDSELHRRREVWEFDAWANAELDELGWQYLRVTASMMRSPPSLIRKIGLALERGRG